MRLWPVRATARPVDCLGRKARPASFSSMSLRPDGAPTTGHVDHEDGGGRSVAAVMERLGDIRHVTTLAAPIADSWRLGGASAVLLRMIGFEPTGEDQAAILRCRKRFKLVVGGGQAGKSKEAAAEHVIHVFEDRHRNPGKALLYWLVAADYERVRAEWNYIIENFRRIGYEVDDSKP